MTGVSITTATGTKDPTSESSEKPKIETSGGYYGSVSKTACKVTLHVKACCSRCNEHITSWTIESHDNHYERPAIIHSFVEERTDLSSELFPNNIAFTYLGPQHVALFQKPDEAKNFLQRAKQVDLKSINWPEPPLSVSKTRQIQPSQEQKRKYRVKLPVQLPPVKEKITFGLACPKCNFLLASAPANQSLGLDGQIVLYKPSLKMVTSKSPIDVYREGPIIHQTDDNLKCRPKLHQGIQIIYSFSSLNKILTESVYSEVSNYNDHNVCLPNHQTPDTTKDLVVMLVAQFWCPFASSALRRIAIFNNRKADCDDESDDLGIIHEKNDVTKHESKQDVSQNTKNTVDSKDANAYSTQPCTFLLLDSFPGPGGVNPDDVLPSSLSHDVQSLPVPSFIVWYRGCRVFIESGSSQHFNCAKGMVIGLDMARYIDILLPRLAHEASIAFATAMLGTAATRNLVENDIDGIGHENTKTSVPLKDAAKNFIKDGVVPLEERPVLKIVL